MKQFLCSFGTCPRIIDLHIIRVYKKNGRSAIPRGEERIRDRAIIDTEEEWTLFRIINFIQFPGLSQEAGDATFRRDGAQRPGETSAIVLKRK